LRYLFKSLDPSSHVESNFHDGSHGLFSLYNDKTAEYDKHLADNWTEGARDLMVLVRDRVTWHAAFCIASVDTYLPF
jgi:hypothetical protein